jgi:uncharacterized protein CbrC (UPF0167 family)
VAQLATFGSELNRPARDRVNENLTREIMLRVGELTGRQADQLLHQASAAARIGDTDRTDRGQEVLAVEGVRQRLRQ